MRNPESWRLDVEEAVRKIESRADSDQGEEAVPPAAPPGLEDIEARRLARKANRRAIAKKVAKKTVVTVEEAVESAEAEPPLQGPNVGSASVFAEAAVANFTLGEILDSTLCGW